MLSPSFRRFLSRIARTTHQQRIRTRFGRFQPRLELLEDRMAPTTNTWTGAADHLTWNLAGNWSAGIPVSGQDVVIPSQGVNNTLAVNLSGAAANIDSLTSAL